MILIFNLPPTLGVLTLSFNSASASRGGGEGGDASGSMEISEMCDGVGELGSASSATGAGEGEEVFVGEGVAEGE